MGWLHTWVGLIVGWVLLFVFLTGSAGYFDVEIDRWMQPERPLHSSIRFDEVAAASNGLEHLKTEAPNAERWFIGLPDERDPLLLVFWREQDSNMKRPKSGRRYLDATTAASISFRDTGGGQLLYRMHYRLHYLTVLFAEWIVGICTMFMLVALTTGLIIHKRIFRDFFTFRPHKNHRSWLDVHNAFGVLALPFHLMITYSGLMFFAYFLMAPVVVASYGLGEDAQTAYSNELLTPYPMPAPAGVRAQLLPLDPLLQEAQGLLGAPKLQFIDIHNPGDANARIIVYAVPPTPSWTPTELVFNGVTGELLHFTGPHSAPAAIYETLLGLHEGLFAGPVLRWVYFLSGLMGTAMIGAGLVLWTTKRRSKSGNTFGFRLVERLNVGTIVGLPVAIAVYFWANRLIPVGIEGRAAWEAHAMFIAWGVMLAHAFIRPASRGWTEQLWVAAGVFSLLPLLNALTTDKHLGVTLPAGAWELAGFDLTVLAFGAAFAIVAWRVGRRHRSDREHDQRFWTPAHQETEAAE